MSGKIKEKGRIFSVNISKSKGTPKKPVEKVSVIPGFGIENDAHSGEGLRQISLLSIESIRNQTKCPKIENEDTSLKAGDFAENITTENMDLTTLRIGDIVRIGSDVILQISKIGKECHRYCAVYYKIGNCIMPQEGIFACVISGGEIIKGDSVEVIRNV